LVIILLLRYQTSDFQEMSIPQIITGNVCKAQTVCIKYVASHCKKSLLYLVLRTSNRWRLRLNIASL
jgi:hypothetical protein